MRHNLINRIEAIAGILLVALVAAGCLLVIMPFTTALLWAAMICFASWPIHKYIEKICRQRRTLAAIITTTLVGIVAVVPFVLAGIAIDRNSSALIEHIQEFGTKGFPPPPEWTRSLPLVNDYLHKAWAELAADNEKGNLLLKEIFSHSRTWLLRRGMDFGLGLVHLCLSVFVAFFFYRDGEQLVQRVAELGKRVFGETSQRVLNTVGRTVRSVVYGIIFTSVGQAITGLIGFYVAGLPWPLIWTALTLVLSLVPFGAPLVWISASIWLIANKGIGWGLFMLIWGFLGISGIDNFLRPYLISRDIQLPFVFIFFGALGGIIVFGFIGLFLGPTLLAVGYALMQEFLQYRKHKAAINDEEPPTVVS